MSYALTRAARHCGPDDPLLRLVLLVLTMSADRQGVARLGLGALLRETGMDRDTCLCTLEALRADGWFTYPSRQTFHLSLTKLRVGRPAETALRTFTSWSCEHCGALHTRAAHHAFPEVQ